jgi:hypothetical protein
MKKRISEQTQLSEKEEQYYVNHAQNVAIREMYRLFDLITTIIYNDNPENYRYYIHNIIKRSKIKLEMYENNQFSSILKPKLIHNNNTRDIITICDLLLIELGNNRNCIEKIIPYINQMIKYVSDEYFIEGRCIYKKYNQEIIQAVKYLNDDDLSDILSGLRASGDMKNAMQHLYTYLKLHKDQINKRLGKVHKTKGEGEIEVFDIFSNFLNNVSNIRHPENNSTREATQEELKVFFDFGLSLTRLIKIWEKQKSNL